MTPGESDSLHDASVDVAGLDAVALKPSEVDLASVPELPVDHVTIDFEGHEHVPSTETLRTLRSHSTVRVTVPVRADGFDPLGDDGSLAAIPDDVGIVLVAGHPAYLSTTERGRSISPRLAAALDRFPEAWVGTEGIERIALATGATQFELLAPGTERTLRSLRAAGYDGGLAVYAPVALTVDDDPILDALGAYVARRGRVRDRLSEDPHRGESITAHDRAVLLEAIGEYAITGSRVEVRDGVSSLRDAGADLVVGYPARGPVDLL